MRRLVVLASVLMAFGGGWAAPAAAGDKEQCTYTYLADAAARNELINACTRLIDSKRYGGDELALMHNARGFSYYVANQYDRAIRDADEVIFRIRPPRPQQKMSDDNLHMAHYIRGESSYYKRDYDRTIADQTVVIGIRVSASALQSRGQAYYEKGEFDRAIADFTGALREDDKRVLAYAYRAMSFEKKGEWTKALADARKATQLEPNGYSRMSEQTIERVQQAMAPGGAKKSDATVAAAPDPSPSMQDFLTSHVFDEPGILDPAMTANLNAKFAALKAKTSDHILLLTIKSLEGHSIEEGSRELVGRVPFGGTKKNGVLIVIAPNERKAHIEVMSGLQRTLTDQTTKKILNDTIMAGITAGDFAGGLERGVDELIQVLTRGNSEQAKPAAPEVVALPPPPAPAAVVLPPPGPAVAAIAPTPTPSAAPREIRVALVIGNGNYKTATQLPNPANDAADVSAALRKLGFDVVEGRDLDKRAMEDKVREFGRKLDRANLALFFYAGHGLQVGGKNYLVPTDAKLERPGDLSFDTIDVAQVLVQMEAEPRVNLIFLDACRDNPLARTLARSLGTRSSSVGQGLASIQSAIGTMIAYATQPDNVALDGEGRNSPFTAALLKHVATQGLEIGSLMRRVRADVIQATRSKQVPWDHSSLIGDVVLAR